MLPVLAAACAVMTCLGLLAVIVAAAAARRFCAVRPAPGPSHQPPITILRPLCGAEPMLEQALESLCVNLYPVFQIVLGVQDPADPAIAVVARIQQRFPLHQIVLVVDTADHGLNSKISNLINMLPHARHDVLVFCDSDLHVAPDYLAVIAAALQQPGTGLVTTVCAGLPVVPGIAAWLGASAISHCFVPGALLSRELGREDCLGTTMALRRATLAEAGGLVALCNHLADDNALGRLIHRMGLSIALARTIPATAVTERSLGALWKHELRWARTIRMLEPMLYALSIIQYPLFWAALCCLAAPSLPTALLFAGAWLIRAGMAVWVDATIQPGRPAPAARLTLLPLRDLLSGVEVIASFTGTRVEWRGRAMRVDAGPLKTSSRPSMPWTGPARPGGFAP